MSNKLSISIGENSRIDFRVANCEKTYHCKAYYDYDNDLIKYRVASVLGNTFGAGYSFNSLEEVREYVLEDSKEIE